MARVKQFTVVETVIAARNSYRRQVYRKGETLHIGIVEAPLDNRRFLVIARNVAGAQVDRLVHGPWCRQTARKHARDLAQHLSN